MVHNTWSPSPSTSSSSSGATSINSNTMKNGRTKNNNNIYGKCLVEQIPLVEPPSLNCKNLSLLEDSEFVNVVFEKDLDVFRVSDHNNKEVCRILRHREAESYPKKKGVKYLECCDILGNCVLYVAYPVGLGEMAILSPSEELIGECLSNVDFICLSVKVKYNYYDANGHRVMKMTGILPEQDNKDKFTLMVKRNKKEKLAIIKMGMLKSCCNIKFKAGHVSVMERLQIIALWTGFMYNELQDTEIAILLERHEQAKKEKEESRSRKKPLFAWNATPVAAPTPLDKDVDKESLSHKVTNSPTTVDHNSAPPSPNLEMNIEDRKDRNIAKVKFWKNLVTSPFVGQKRDVNHRNDQIGNNNNNIGNKGLGNIVNKNEESRSDTNTRASATAV